ncbi:MAG TPA: DNA cytosine methyltransferase, partial [Candidatus Lokiarchaeia archaeon]
MYFKSKRSNRLKIKAVDFFCGAGGVTKGLLDAGIDVICGIDNDSKAKKTYENNNIRPNGKKVEFIDCDINKLSFSDLRKRLQNEKYDKLLFVGCAPCQPFTNINTLKEKRKREKNHLIRFADFIEYFNPDYLFVENVPGITAKKYGGILGRFKNILKKLNYYYLDNNINAKNYGIPQNRNRRILIASLGKPISFPEETHGKRKKSYVTILEVLRKYKLKPLKAGEKDSNDPLHRAANLNKTNLWRIKNTPKNGGGRNIWMESKPVECYLRQKNSYTDVYNRMYWNKPSPTITTRFNSLSNGRFGHPEEDRAISLREGALFQT